MADLAQMIAWRDRLRQARYGGIRELRDQNGESVTYKSDSEMASALRALENDIAAAQSVRPSITYIQTSKGL